MTKRGPFPIKPFIKTPPQNAPQAQITDSPTVSWRNVSAIQEMLHLRKLRFSMTGRGCHCLSVNSKF
ncbi:hypothetical protein [Mariniradius saccharolyticus]|uniref:hypothetical protein n=1 Tax=Mariniradius saccharolyticus TaxID=1245591 RepID=UPI0012F6B526|nr:hypothetical protein [Mariniradius saccharolyticus]